MAFTVYTDSSMGAERRQDTFNQGGLFGGLGGVLGNSGGQYNSGLESQQRLNEASIRARHEALMAQAEYQARALMIQNGNSEIRYKPTIEAGDPIIDVLQAEIDEWLRDIE